MLMMADQKGKSMLKEVFNTSYNYLGTATRVEEAKSGLEVTFPGDFPGMRERTVIYTDGMIIADDDYTVIIWEGLA